jgi:hypothetical protein
VAPPVAPPAPAIVQPTIAAPGSSIPVRNAKDCMSLIRSGTSKTKKEGEGLADLKRAVDHCNGKVPAAWLQAARTNLGANYAMLRQWDDALRELNAANLIKPSWVTYVNIAYVLTRGQREVTGNAEAMEHLRRADTLSPNGPPKALLDVAKSWGSGLQLYTQTVP